MENFTYWVPTKVYFGKDTHKQVGTVIKEYGFSKIMIHYGGGSVQKTGLLDQVTQSLRDSGIEYVLFGGCKAKSGFVPCQRGNGSVQTGKG